MLLHLADVQNCILEAELAHKLDTFVSEVDLPLLERAVLPGRDDRLAVDPT